MEIYELLQSGQAYKYIHYFIILVFLCLIYLVVEASFSTERKRKRLKFQLKLNTKNSWLRNWLTNESIDHALYLLGISKYIKSIHVNLFRFLSLIITMLIIQLENILGIYILSSFTVLMVVTFFIVTWPLKLNFLFNFFVDQLTKNKERKKNAEVYSLYSQLKADFQTKKTGNIYNLLLDYRKYYTLIRPAIEKALYQWKEGKDLAWETFANEIGTSEAHSLANIMKEIETESRENAIIILEKKRDEFANSNYNAFKDYLTLRQNVFYFIVFACTIVGIFGNIGVSFFLYFIDLMNEVNSSL